MASSVIHAENKFEVVLGPMMFSAANKIIPNYAMGKKYLIALSLNGEMDTYSTKSTEIFFVGRTDKDVHVRAVFGNGWIGYLWINILPDGTVQPINAWKNENDGEWIDLSGFYFSVFEI